MLKEYLYVLKSAFYNLFCAQNDTASHCQLARQISACNRVQVIPYNATSPKSSVDVTGACTSVLQANSGRYDLTRANFS